MSKPLLIRGLPLKSASALIGSRWVPLATVALACLVVAVTAAAHASAAVSSSTVSTQPAAAPKPKIVIKLIPFGAARRAETAAYAQRHYGIDTWRLEHPHVIVEHYTASNSFAPPTRPSRPTRPTRSSASCRASARTS